METPDRIAYDAHRNFDGKVLRAGCYAPYVSVYLNTFGDVLACCKNVTYPLGNVAKERLPDIWRGQKAGKLRVALENYRFEAGCQMCEWEIVGGDYKGAFPAVFENYPVESADPEWPSMIEFAGSNTCNFECVMCAGEFSSSIRSRREGLPPLPRVYGDQFFQDLRAFLPHLRMAKFLGGEPFLAEECFRIWDMMIEDGLSVPCHVTTNASQYNEKVERVLNAMPVNLCISLDGATKQTVESIRINCIYDEFIANIRRFSDYAKRRGTNLSFAHCLMRQNWHEFGDVLRFAESMGGRVFVNTVMGGYSVYTLPPEETLRIAGEMEKLRSRGEEDLKINQGVWEGQIQKLRNNAHARMTERLSKLQVSMDGAWLKRAGGVMNDVMGCWSLIEAGKYAEAIDKANRIPEEHAYYYYSLVVAAHARRLMGDFEGAENDVARVMRLSRRRPEGFIERAWLRAFQGRLEEAAADAAQAKLVRKPGDGCDGAIESVLAYVRERQSDVVAPADAASQAVARKPADPAA